MADVICNECGKSNEDVICVNCYNDIKNQLSQAEIDLYNQEKEIVALTDRVRQLEDMLEKE